jgi:hypothetical protein
MTTSVPLHDSRGHIWRVLPDGVLLRRADGVEMPADRVIDVFGYGSDGREYLLGRFDKTAIQPHTPDVDYLRGAADALAAIARRLAHDGKVYPADAQMLKDAATELGVTVTDWTEVDT